LLQQPAQRQATLYIPSSSLTACYFKDKLHLELQKSEQDPFNSSNDWTCRGWVPKAGRKPLTLVIPRAHVHSQVVKMGRPRWTPRALERYPNRYCARKLN
jgi:hypothetical protein